MISLFQIESDLKDALKAKDGLKANTLRGLKARIQNEQIAKTRDLSEPELLALVRSEAKRRKDAEQAYIKGGRADLADKESKEARVLAGYLPAQIPEGQLLLKVEAAISAMSATSADFGRVMAKLKNELGDSADGGTLAKLLKEKLK